MQNSILQQLYVVQYLSCGAILVRTPDSGYVNSVATSNITDYYTMLGQYGIVPEPNGYLSFQVEACKDALILLSENFYLRSPLFYEICFGCSDNTIISIRRMSVTDGVKTVSIPRISGTDDVKKASTPRIFGTDGVKKASTPRISGTDGVKKASTPRISGTNGVKKASTPRKAGTDGVKTMSTPRMSGTDGVKTSSSPWMPGTDSIKTASTPKILSCNQFRPFTVRWFLNGTIQVEKSSKIVLKWTDPLPISVHVLGIMTSYGSKGSWILEQNEGIRLINEFNNKF
ncbi:unnamed protein product [Mytilus coruscus]|uniref:Farnesoic acid O-methyl transferase domain-containing protein n=1 Tax=Mytilus coruscus TaxID=42192 RepID=A0A6J8DUU3_MYTCO|nr:unnamed protein product [Mytilus coruscus]